MKWNKDAFMFVLNSVLVALNVWSLALSDRTGYPVLWGSALFWLIVSGVLLFQAAHKLEIKEIDLL